MLPNRCTSAAAEGQRPEGTASSRFALAFDPPRIFVIIDTPPSPIASLPSQTGTLSGGFAPTARASAGSQVETGAGSSSTML